MTVGCKPTIFSQLRGASPSKVFSKVVVLLLSKQTPTILIWNSSPKPSSRATKIRDTLSALHVLGVVCKDVVIEPSFLPINNEELPRDTTLTADARLDISCRGFFSPLDKTFIDIRVLHPISLSNAVKPLKGMYQAHEKEKKPSTSTK